MRVWTSYANIFYNINKCLGRDCGSRYRSSPVQQPEKQQKTSSGQEDLRARSSQVSRNDDIKLATTPSNRCGSRRGNCGTLLSCNRSTRGLGLRGATYQFRVRDPADLRQITGCERVNRSLRTDSRSLAIRLSRRVSTGFDGMFEAKRLEIGLPVDARLLPSDSVSATVGETIGGRSRKASDATPSPTLSQTYDHTSLAQQDDGQLRRCARTKARAGRWGKCSARQLSSRISSVRIVATCSKRCDDCPSISLRSSASSLSAMLHWQRRRTPRFAP